MEFRPLAGEAYSKHSLVHISPSVEGADGGLVPVGLGGPPAPAPLLRLLLRVSRSTQWTL